jgi:hypothetical protein
MAMLNNQMVISGVVKIPAQLFYLNPDMRDLAACSLATRDAQ